MKGRQKYISLAALQARKSPMGHKHGAVVVRNKTVIGKGYNYNYPGVKYGLYSLHAEVAALVHAGCNKQFLKGSVIYVVRVNSGGEFRESKPCSKCTEYIKKYGIRKVYYSVSE